MLALPPQDREFLAEEFGRGFQHPATRAAASRLTFGSDSPPLFPDVLDRLFRLVACESPRWVTTMMNRDPWAELSAQVITAISTLANTPPRDRVARKDASKKLLLAVEPVISKYLSVADRDEHQKQLAKRQKPGLHTLIARLRQLALLPSFEVLTDEAFRSPAGWENRDSFANALRDLLPERIMAAHESTSVEDHVWKSAMAIMLAIADHMPSDIAARLPQPLPPARVRSVIGLPASRFSADGPPAGRKISEPCPEPLTTRRNTTAQVVNSLAPRVDSSSPFVCIVDGPWGWGKSVFTARVLTELRRPTLHIDMAEVGSLCQMAEAALRQVPLEASDRQQIDIDPAYAFELLADSLPHHAIVWLESVRGQSDLLDEDQLSFAIRSLVSLGLSVFVECWAPVSLPAVGLTQDRIIRIAANDLPAIDADETRLWAVSACNRPLIDEEIDSLGFLGGNPLQLRLALERIRTYFPTAQPEALDEELLAFAGLIEEHKAYRTFLMQNSMDVQAHGSLGSRLCAVIACFPTCDLEPSRGFDDQLRRLARIGLVTTVGGRWRTSSWLRLLALREFGTTAGPAVEDIRAAIGCIDLSAITEPAIVRRHLLNLQARRPDALQSLAELSTALPQSAATAEPVANYTAPLELTNVAPAPSPRPLEWLSLALSDACRTNESESALILAIEVTTAQPTALSGFLQSPSDGRATLLSAVPLLPDETAISLHQVLAEPLTAVTEPGPSSLSIARYLLEASDCSLRVGDLAQGGAWRDAAKQKLQLAQSLLDDFSPELRYEANALGIRLADSESERLALHSRTLQAIPSPDVRNEESASVWAIRSLEHALPLLVASPSSFELLSRARLEFSIAGASASWFSVWRRYREAADFLPGPILPLITEAIGGMAHHLATRRSPHQHRRLSRVFHQASLSVDQAAAIVTAYATSSSRSIATDDAILLDEALRCLTRAKTPPRGRARQLADAAEGILGKVAQGVSEHFPEYGRLRRSSLLFLIEHLLMTVRTTDAALWNQGTTRATHARFLDRLVWLTRRCGNPWAWNDGLNAIFRLQSILLRQTHVSKRLQVLELCNADRSHYVTEAAKTLNNHPATLLLRLRIARYTWDWPEAVATARNLFRVQVPEPYTSDAEDAIYDLVATVILIPPDLRAWTPPADEDEACRVMLLQILDSRIAREGRKPRQSVLEFQRRLATNDCPSDAWTQLANTLAECIGPPRDYWQDVILKRLNQDDTLTDADDEAKAFDLTDMDWLFELGTVVRFGMADTRIDLGVRRKLGEYAVAIIMDIMSWHRSFETSNFLWRWHLGTSVVYALLTSQGTTPALFEDVMSPLSTHKGNRLTWVGLARRDLMAVANGPDTQFTRFAREKGAELMLRLRERGWTE